MEAGEGDVWVVRAVFRGEAAAGHGVGHLGLELEERTGGFDLCDEDAGSREGVQAGEFQGKGREGKLGECVFKVGDGGFGDIF